MKILNSCATLNLIQSVLALLFGDNSELRLCLNEGTWMVRDGWMKTDNLAGVWQIELMSKKWLFLYNDAVC